MIRIHSITIQGFRSFTKAQHFVLPDRKGLYFMSGRNLADPGLGSNGAGKSTVWEAVGWCFTGKTSRGLKAGSVANWGGKHPTRVELELSDGGASFGAGVLTRTWNPNTLSWRAGHADDGHPEEQPLTQEQLEKMLGVDFDTLSCTMLMSQFGRYFFDLSPTEKLTLFSGLFDLEYWLGCADRAKAQAKKAESAVAACSLAVERAVGAMTALRPRLDDAATKAAEWDNRSKESSSLQRKAVEVLRQTLDLAKEESRKAARERDSWDSKKMEAQRVLVAADEHLISVAIPAEREAQRDSEDVLDKISGYKKQIERAEQLGEGRCPTCYGEVSRKRLERVIEAIKERKIAPLREQGAQATRTLEKAQRRLQRAQDARKEAEGAFVQAEKALERARRHASDLARVTQDKERDLLAATEQLQKTKDQENPHQATVRSIRDEIKSLASKHKEAMEERTEALQRLDHAQYWVGMFKDLRLWTIERALLDFTICVNNALMDLGLEGWKVTFDVERATAAGGVSKGFTVLIESPDSGGPVPWESWCGGETQRLRIAGAIGLSDLVRSQRGFSIMLEVWDEPTQHLSREGVEDMLRFFQARAADQGKQIWLVDHLANPGAEFDGAVTVVRDSTGSHFESKQGKKPRVHL